MLCLVPLAVLGQEAHPPLQGDEPSVSSLCSHRDSSVSMRECEERLLVNAPRISQCDDLKDEAYRLCVVRLPSPLPSIVKKKTKAQIDADAASVIARSLNPEQKSSTSPKKDMLKLPTPREAVLESQIDAANAGRVLTSEEVDKAYDDALQAEFKAIREGHPELVDSEAIIAYNVELIAQYRKSELAHCHGQVEIGTTEEDVYCLLGKPDQVNDDLIGGKQLVYPGNFYVYIDPKTYRVTDVQRSY